MKRAVSLALAAAVAVGVPVLVAQERAGRSAADGLPRGTIIAWSPPPGVHRPPPGWLVCDRTTHERHDWIPDLSGRFLQGAVRPFAEEGSAGPSDVGQLGGSVTHDHAGSRVPPGFVSSRNVGTATLGTAMAQANHSHEVTITPATHLPPYAKVVFLIRAE